MTAIRRCHQRIKLWQKCVHLCCVLLSTELGWNDNVPLLTCTLKQFKDAQRELEDSKRTYLLVCASSLCNLFSSHVVTRFSQVSNLLYYQIHVIVSRNREKVVYIVDFNIIYCITNVWSLMTSWPLNYFIIIERVITVIIPIWM